MARSTTLLIRIIADATQAYKKMSGFGKAMVPAMAGATAITGALGMMAKAAAEDAQGQALLANSLKKTTGATSKQVAGVEDWIAKTAMATGVADDELRPAMAALARSTGDVSTAQEAMGVALDVAAATGKDTESVAGAIAKAYAGNTTALGRMVPGIDKAVLKSGNMTKIMGELSRVTGGSAAVAAETAAGKFKRASLAFDEAKETAGAALLPVLTALGSKLVAVGKFASQHSKLIQIMAIVLGGLAATVYAVSAAMAVYNTYTRLAALATKLFAKEGLVAKAMALATRVATLAWAAAQAVLNVILTANPIGLVVVAIAALIAIIIIAYKKSATFRSIVQAAFKGIMVAAVAVKNAFIVAWNAVKTALGAVWNWLKANVFGPIIAYYAALWKGAGKAVGLVITAWQGLKSGLSKVWDWLQSNVFGPLQSAFGKVVDAVKKVIEWIGKIKIPKAVQSIIDKVGGVFSVAPAPPAPPAPRVRTARTGGARAATTSYTASRDRGAGALTVNVILDGKKVGGYLDRIITTRLNTEGARAAAGSWA